MACLSSSLIPLQNGVIIDPSPLITHSRSDSLLCLTLRAIILLLKWQAFSVVLQERSMAILCHLPLMQTLSTVCMAILIILNYFSKNIFSASNCWVSDVIREATDYTWQELLHPLTGKADVIAAFTVPQPDLRPLHGHCASQQDLRHPSIVLEKTSMPTLLSLLFVLTWGICILSKDNGSTYSYFNYDCWPSTMDHLSGWQLSWQWLKRKSCFNSLP